MILANGILYDTKEQPSVLEGLQEKLTKTLIEQRLDKETVINAFDALGKKVAQGELNDLIDSIEFDGKEKYIDLIERMMSKEYLRSKTDLELDGRLLSNSSLITRQVPLGIIFHIAAGNMDVLPVASVAEGLLAGNINILKLPSVDSGLTVRALKILVDQEPKLKDFIYVFDTPSSDISTMKKLADLSDGIAVWGGDEAIKAVRQLSKPGTRLIEWGHKLGFCYISGFENEEEELKGLAEHIMLTRQLLCSSCQVIYIDSDSFDDAMEFGKKFLTYLDNASDIYPIREIGAVAEITLRRYSDRISSHIRKEDAEKDEFVLTGRSTTVTVKKDNSLELSYMYGNVIVKPLPSKDLSSVLRKSKEYLQTAGLICSPSKRTNLTETILRCGIERVTRAGHMSEFFEGEAHDGEFALSRYSRYVNIES